MAENANNGRNGWSIRDIHSLLPEFDGKNPSIDCFASMCRDAAPLATCDDMMLIAVKFKLRGEAREYVDTKDYANLEELLTDLRNNFEKPVELSDLVAELHRISQKYNEPVADYGTRARKIQKKILRRLEEVYHADAQQQYLANRRDELKQEIIRSFIRGLFDKIVNMLVQRNIVTLDQAILEAIHVEYELEKSTAVDQCRKQAAVEDGRKTPETKKFQFAQMSTVPVLKFCEYHKSSTHNSSECTTIQRLSENRFNNISRNRYFLNQNLQRGEDYSQNNQQNSQNSRYCNNSQNYQNPQNYNIFSKNPQNYKNDQNPQNYHNPHNYQTYENPQKYQDPQNYQDCSRNFTPSPRNRNNNRRNFAQNSLHHPCSLDNQYKQYSSSDGLQTQFPGYSRAEIEQAVEYLKQKNQGDGSRNSLTGSQLQESRYHAINSQNRSYERSRKEEEDMVRRKEKEDMIRKEEKDVIRRKEDEEKEGASVKRKEVNPEEKEKSAAQRKKEDISNEPICSLQQEVEKSLLREEQLKPCLLKQEEKQGSLKQKKKRSSSQPQEMEETSFKENYKEGTSSKENNKVETSSKENCKEEPSSKPGKIKRSSLKTEEKHSSQGKYKEDGIDTSEQQERSISLQQEKVVDISTQPQQKQSSSQTNVENQLQIDSSRFMTRVYMYNEEEGKSSSQLIEKGPMWHKQNSSKQLIEKSLTRHTQICSMNIIENNAIQQLRSGQNQNDDEKATVNETANENQTIKLGCKCPSTLIGEVTVGKIFGEPPIEPTFRSPLMQVELKIDHGNSAHPAAEPNDGQTLSNLNNKNGIPSVEPTFRSPDTPHKQHVPECSDTFNIVRKSFEPHFRPPTLHTNRKSINEVNIYHMPLKVQPNFRSPSTFDKTTNIQSPLHVAFQQNDRSFHNGLKMLYVFLQFVTTIMIVELYQLICSKTLYKTPAYQIIF